MSKSKGRILSVRITPEMERDIDSYIKVLCTPESGKTEADLKRYLLTVGLFAVNKKHEKTDFFKCECSYANAVLPQPNEVTQKMHSMDTHMASMDKKIEGLYLKIDDLLRQLKNNDDASNHKKQSFFSTQVEKINKVLK
jgi:hypothetical protein